MKKLYSLILFFFIGFTFSVSAQKIYKPIREALKAKNASQALRLIAPLLSDSMYKGEERLYEYSIEAHLMAHEKENTKAYLKQAYDTVQFFRTSLGVIENIFILDSLEQQKEQKKRKVAAYTTYINRFLPNINAAGRYFLKQKKYADAITFFNLFLSTPSYLFPKHKIGKEKYTESAYLCTKSYFLKQDFQQVRKYEAILLSDSTYLCSSLEFYAIAAETLKDTCAYLHFLRKGVQLCPSNAYYFTRLADYYIINQQPQYTLYLADSLLQRDSSLVVAMEGRCLALMSLQQYPKAIQQAKAILKVDSTAINPHYYIGASLCNIADLTPAVNNINSKDFVKNERKRKALFKSALPSLERFRTLVPDKKDMWGPLLYKIYLSTGNEQKFKEIDALLQEY